MPATNCPFGCNDPCFDWHDWERCVNCHAPFHHWRWNNSDPVTSRQRLGERVYILACLLWTAIHDRTLGQRLLNQSPNWSAVCNYYSMVHCLRLFWFLLYGSYSTGHRSLAMGLQSGGSGAKGDWSNDELRPGRIRLLAPSFQMILREAFNDRQLADRVPYIGAMFEKARVLRNDSNYESLVLAHQYSHRSPEIYIPDEMARTAEVMSSGSRFVLQYTTRVMAVVFNEDHQGIGAGSPYSASDLKALLLCYVHDKIQGANDGQDPNHSALADWLREIPELRESLMEPVGRDRNPARELVDCIQYSVFGEKRRLMIEFQDKVRHLEQSLNRALSGTT